MDKPAVTLDQAKAFVEALSGWVAVGVADEETVWTPASPAARTHLEAILGHDNVPTAVSINYSIEHWHGKRAIKYREDTLRLAEYLSEVGRALKEAIRSESE